MWRQQIIAVLLVLWSNYVASFIPRISRFSFGSSSNESCTCSLHDAASTSSSTTTDERATKKQQLLDLLAQVPRNAATSRRETQAILDTVRQLEPLCPTLDAEVLTNSAGTWELLWTAQDSQASGPLSAFRWINPLENQAYSNNPMGGGGGGRANPILPLDMQNFLTDRGIIRPQVQEAFENDDPGRTSTQTIDVKNGRVINVVSVPLRGSSKPAALTVRVDFAPHTPDPRRVNVKFQSFSVALGEFKVNLPLGIIGPTGWLRTTFLDDQLRITRGHKGSVFVLRRRTRKNK